MDLKKILIADNNSDTISYLMKFLYKEPYELFTAKNKIECIEILRKKAIDLAIVEMYMRDMDGLSLLKWIKKERIYTTILIMTDMGTIELGEAVIKKGAASVFDKPIKKEVFLAKLRRYIPQQDMWKVWLESFLEDNYSNPYLNFEDVRSFFRFSKSYGHALFKKHLGKTFREKLMEIRIEKATYLLEETILPISEIAKRCGFRSPQRLSESFRKLYCISPIAYRNRSRVSSERLRISA